VPVYVAANIDAMIAGAERLRSIVGMIRMLPSPKVARRPYGVRMTEPPRPPGDGYPGPTEPVNPRPDNDSAPSPAPGSPPPPSGPPFSGPPPSGPPFSGPPPSGPPPSGPPPSYGASGYGPPPSSGAGGYGPPPSSGAGGYGPQPGPPPYGYGRPPGVSSDEERTWILIAHFGGGVLAFITSGWFGWVAPLIALLAKGNQSPAVRQHSAAALNFQLLWAVVALAITVISTCLTLIVIGAFGFLLLVVPWLMGTIFGIVAGVKAANGEPYQYPGAPNWVK
jgi:uncharacterized Tic20 family protein